MLITMPLICIPRTSAAYSLVRNFQPNLTNSSNKVHFEARALDALRML